MTRGWELLGWLRVTAAVIFRLNEGSENIRFGAARGFVDGFQLANGGWGCAAGKHAAFRFAAGDRSADGLGDGSLFRFFTPPFTIQQQG